MFGIQLDWGLSLTPRQLSYVYKPAGNHSKVANISKAFRFRSKQSFIQFSVPFSRAIFAA